MGASFSCQSVADNSMIDPDLKVRYPEQLFTNIKINGKSGVDVLVNTCASFNFVHPVLVRELGLEVFPTDEQTSSVGGKVTKYAEKCVVTATMPDGFTLRNVECIVREKTSCEILMTLGHEFLRSFSYVSLKYNGPYPKITTYPSQESCFIDVAINKIDISNVFLDSASRQSVMSMAFAKKLDVRIVTEIDTQTMAITDAPKYYCMVPLNVAGNFYQNFKIRILEKVQIKMLLGIDFISLHRVVKIMYNGPMHPLKFKRQEF